MNEKQCKDCQYYLQHFTFDGRKIVRVYCGHCTFSRARQKRPDLKACENFAPGSAQEEAFVSKEYLSKELLHYMLSLDLLPNIEDGR
ncbi:MAG: hypothetical protein J6A68_00415 [Oscillospiraceae bacterium]|nr:hypothetical protein [Oscillospiraceae bacterium]